MDFADAGHSSAGVGIVLDHVDDLALVPKLLHMLKPGIVKLDMAIGRCLIETALRECALPAAHYTVP